MTFPSRHLLVLLCCIFVYTFPAFAQNGLLNEASKKELMEKLDSYRERKGLVSLSFGFFHGDNIAFQHASGLADKRGKVKATPDHIYTIASVTKCITAMTMVDLINQNYLSLGDSVHKIIEGMPQNITVKDLLNHTSGFLREKENEHFLTGSHYQDVAKYLPVKFNLKIHRYANYNYSVAGAVISKITGSPFHEVANEYYQSVTGEPLYFSNHDKKGTSGKFVRNYVKKGRRILSHEPVEFGLWEPAAFAQTTARGLAKFLRYHMTPQFLQFIESNAVKIKSYKRYGKVHKECYALGFRLRYVDDELLYVFHNGFLYGVISTLYYFPQKDAGFVALSNISSYPRQTLGLGGLYRIVERILDKQYNEDLALYTANYGFGSGWQYYNDTKSHGTPREKSLSNSAAGYLKKGQNEEAIGLLKLIKQLFPGSSKTYRQLSEAYMKNGEEELAEEALIQGLMADPKKSKKSAGMLKHMDSENVN